ncbi:hypothetical protein WNY37_00440 [Henriciella sp. AS95]|uniref:hypothetical protein n=1 Tax=Henriciella sp. AS95 TaxID=3135782 RepID=UPI00317F33F2
MFDARDSEAKSGGGLIFGLATVALVSVLFVGVLYFPSLTGPGKSEVAASEQPENITLLSAFEDEPTRTFIRKLRRTFPSEASALERDVLRARSRGADEVELGLIVMQAGTHAVASSIDRLSMADEIYAERILETTSQALRELSASGAPYCKGSDLIQFAKLSDQELYAAVFDRVGHGAGLYDFGLELNGIFLDAIRDARADPIIHGRLTSSDMGALQRLGLSVMTNPDLMLLLTTEGKSRSEMDAAVASVNFCDLGAKLIEQVNDLPDGTKGRVWAELWIQVERDGIERMFYRYAY